MTLAVTGGRVWDGTGTEARPATVLVDGALIRAVGSELPIPDGTELIDATGAQTVRGSSDSPSPARESLPGESARA